MRKPRREHRTPDPGTSAPSARRCRGAGVSTLTTTPVERPEELYQREHEHAASPTDDVLTRRWGGTENEEKETGQDAWVAELEWRRCATSSCADRRCPDPPLRPCPSGPEAVLGRCTRLHPPVDGPATKAASAARSRRRRGTGGDAARKRTRVSRCYRRPRLVTFGGRRVDVRHPARVRPRGSRCPRPPEGRPGALPIRRSLAVASTA